MTHFGHTTIAGEITQPGRYLLRTHYNPYWTLAGNGCVVKGPDKMTSLVLDSAGRFSLSVPGTPDGLFAAATRRHGAC